MVGHALEASMMARVLADMKAREAKRMLVSGISDYVRRFASAEPETLAIVSGDVRMNYSELETSVSDCARALLASGIAKGDIAACLAPPSAAYWITFLAATRIGAVWLGLNPKYQLSELRYLVDDARPKLVFSIDELGDRSFTDFAHMLNTDHGFIEKVVALRGALPGAQSYDEFISLGAPVNDAQLRARASSIDRLDPALLVYTSGSTGSPKGALVSHHGLSFGAEVQNRHYRLKSPKMLCAFPINHVACVADTCCVNLVAGGTLVFHERFDPDAVLKAIETEKITVLLCVPTMLMMLLDHPDFVTTDLSSLEMIAWGGAALPVPIIEKLRAIVPRLMNVYGLTETAANVTYSDEGADIIQLSETVGRPDPDMPCRIMNDAGSECAVGEDGELQFKGDYLLLAYLNRAEATKGAYTEDGWLKTGDVGHWREDGTITLAGRKSDMFKSGGYNVYPREVELLLESHDQVRMAAVIAMPDPLYQEVGAAYVIPVKCGANATLTEDALRAFCKAHLANYKIPKRFCFVDSLPLLPVGKVDKVQLKQEAARCG